MDQQDIPSGATVVARERATDEIVILSTGFRARIRCVAASLIEEVASRIEDPPVPLWHNPDRDRDEPNPMDPQYQVDLTKVTRHRGVASIDAMVMFGLDMEDPLPLDDLWIEKLRALERLGHLSLTGYDLTHPIDREFLFKRFVAVGSDDLLLIARRSGIQEEAVQKAAGSFQGSKVGNPDQ